MRVLLAMPKGSILAEFWRVSFVAIAHLTAGGCGQLAREAVSPRRKGRFLPEAE